MTIDTIAVAIGKLADVVQAAREFRTAIERDHGWSLDVNAEYQKLAAALDALETK